MSPGSTAHTRSPGSSTAGTAASWSRAALDAPYPPQAAEASAPASGLTAITVPAREARSSGSVS
ncbi:hypothetical protein SUDANB15_01724 [Streptomyces sp. enrichment culture]